MHVYWYEWMTKTVDLPNINHTRLFALQFVQFNMNETLHPWPFVRGNAWQQVDSPLWRAIYTENVMISLRPLDSLPLRSQRQQNAPWNIESVYSIFPENWYVDILYSTVGSMVSRCFDDENVMQIICIKQWTLWYRDPFLTKTLCRYSVFSNDEYGIQKRH